jgi:hypothetical protein
MAWGFKSNIQLGTSFRVQAVHSLTNNRRSKMLQPTAPYQHLASEASTKVTLPSSTPNFHSFVAADSGESLHVGTLTARPYQDPRHQCLAFTFVPFPFVVTVAATVGQHLLRESGRIDFVVNRGAFAGVRRNGGDPKPSGRSSRIGKGTVVGTPSVKTLDHSVGEAT